MRYVGYAEKGKQVVVPVEGCSELTIGHTRVCEHVEHDPYGVSGWSAKDADRQREDTTESYKEDKCMRVVVPDGHIMGLIEVSSWSIKILAPHSLFLAEYHMTYATEAGRLAP